VTRPHHSAAAFRRLLQMSSPRVFVLVEGRNIDGYFYGSVSRPLCDSRGLECEVVYADRVAGGGGKQSLLSLYAHLAETHSLRIEAPGGTTFCFFFLDKDVDDILHLLVKSPHVIYTPTYNVENLIFMHGQPAAAAAAASAEDPALLRARIPDDSRWRELAASRWKDFVSLCLLSSKLGINCDCNYGNSASPLNAPPDSPTDERALEARLQAASRGLGIDIRIVKRKFEASRRIVERCYAGRRYDLVFNGKWYFHLLEFEVQRATGDVRAGRHALRNSVEAALLTGLDFAAPWVEHFRQPMRNILT